VACAACLLVSALGLAVLGGRSSSEAAAAALAGANVSTQLAMGDEGSMWDLGAALRRWRGEGGGGSSGLDALAEAGEVGTEGDGAEAAPVGAEGDANAAVAGGAAPAAQSGEEEADEAAAAAGRSEEVAERASLAAFPHYEGPPTLGGTPDPNEAAWLLPAAAGVDVQIRRDLSPWRTGGISRAELALQLSHRGALPNDNSTSVWNQPPGIFTAVVWKNVPYLKVSEVRFILRSFLFGAVLKILDFLRLLFAVGRSAALPNTLFIWNADPWPVQLGKAAHSDLAPRPSAPVFSLCKADSHWDVLYPSMYFKSVSSWANVTSSLSRAATRDGTPWRRRAPRLWWRGSGGKFWPGSGPRVFAVGSWWRQPWADLAFTDQWDFSVAHWKGTPLWDTFPPGMEQVPSGKRLKMPMEAVARYRYALHLPGFYAATYSRMLQFLLWAGATVFVLDCPYYEFYYHRLQPWQHYVPVNVSSIGERYAWAQANEAAAAGIAWRGRAAAREHIGPRHFADYWAQLLTAYTALLDFKLEAPPPGLCTCWPGADKHHKPPHWVHKSARSCGVLCSDRLIIKTGKRTNGELPQASFTPGRRAEAQATREAAAGAPQDHRAPPRADAARRGERARR